MSTLGRARRRVYPIGLGRLGKPRAAGYPTELVRIRRRLGRHGVKQGCWVAGYVEAARSSGTRRPRSRPRLLGTLGSPSGGPTHVSTHAKSGIPKSLFSLCVYWVERENSLLDRNKNPLTGRRTRTSRTIERVLTRRNRTQLPTGYPTQNRPWHCERVAFREGLPKCT